MEETFTWTNQDNPLKIEMTIALPVLNAEKIIWLALESLRLQQKVDFGWELICWEEHGKSREVIKSFVGKLPNCQRILHRSLDPVRHGAKSGKFRGKIILIRKWVGICSQSSPTSKIYVLHAADCYSPPLRLYIHYHHFKKNKCLFSTQPVGAFYNIRTGQIMLYNGHHIDSKKFIRTHLNMALRTRDMRCIKVIGRNRRIDAHILASVKTLNKLKSMKGRIFSDATISKTNWRYSLDTDGFNNISASRKNFYNKKRKGFVNYKIALGKYLPKQVVLFLRSLRKVPKVTKTKKRRKSVYKHPTILRIASKYRWKHVRNASRLLKDKKVTPDERNKYIAYLKKLNLK